jgi:hypothetical protein
MAALEAIPITGRVVSLSHALADAGDITAPADGTAIGTAAPGTQIAAFAVRGRLGGQSGAVMVIAMFVINNTAAAANTIQLRQRVISSDGLFYGPVFMTITIPASSQYGGVWTYRAKTFPGAKAADGRMDSSFANNELSLFATASAAGAQTGTGHQISTSQAIVLLHIAGN